MENTSYYYLFEPTDGSPSISDSQVTIKKGVLSYGYADIYSFFRICISADKQVNYLELNREEVEYLIEVASGYLTSKHSQS